MVLVLLWGCFFGIKTEVFACTNGDTQCSGSSVQVYTDSVYNVWTTTTTCPYGCSGGACLPYVCTDGT